MAEVLDIAIIGTGAAGLMAAIFAGRTLGPERRGRVAALDGAKILGAKILVSGGGRCNVTHDVVTPDDFNAANRNQIAKVLRSFDVAATTNFFADLGVTLKREETGKLFPTTDDADTVLQALLAAAAVANAALLPDHRVTTISPAACGFALTTPHGDFHTKTLILATGGKSLPKTGSDGFGYELAQSLGHTVTPTHPALVPLILEERHWLTTLTGISADAELALASATGKVLHRQRGSTLFTHFGLSGPAVMDISRHWIIAHETDPAAKLSANLLPARSFAQVEQHFIDAARSKPRASVESILRQWFPQRMSDALARHGAKVDPATPMAQLNKDSRRALVHALTALPLPVLRDRGYNYAEVTAGGVPLSEIDINTMASRVCPGLYLCGEILDVDGRIGGYNFQWAWASGRLAGTHAALRTLSPARAAGGWGEGGRRQATG